MAPPPKAAATTAATTTTITAPTSTTKPDPAAATKSPRTTTTAGAKLANHAAAPPAAVTAPSTTRHPDPLDDLDPLVPPPLSRGIDEILASARLNLSRLDPHFAFYILSEPRTPPAVLVDIRPYHQRREEGVIPGALPIERNVLEWRFDPRSAARLEIANRYDLRVIVFCSEGYTSSLAARSLQDLGLWNATDIVGGFKAWKAAGLGRIPEHTQLMG
jgi:rhodanese-related sulfurtransferase